MLPKEGGGIITVSVSDQGHQLACVMDDNGIGRDQSGINKTAKAATHESKGLELIHKRLEVHNQLHSLHDTIRVEDKTGASGRSLGTRITLTFQKRQE